MNAAATFPLYYIPLLPLLGAAFNLLLGRWLGRRTVHFVGCASVFSAFLAGLTATVFHLYPLWSISESALAEGVAKTAPALVTNLFDWITAGEVQVKMGLLLDPLSAIMVGIITLVGFLIHVYSMGYMKDDPDYARFFGYLNLFTAVMLLLVLGDNLVVLFLGWEGVGLCSYLLIGFWYDRTGTKTFGEGNAQAGKKAFIVNRIGDAAFLLGLFLLFSTAGTLNIHELSNKIPILLHLISPFGIKTISIAAGASLLLFIGATGKSAQIPLYVWLPDAMAGPTPVSALIHAATMVTAGVYMIARMNFLYLLSPGVMGIVALVGAGTALFAATIGLAQNDIKKVLAYSTISQLGYMFLSVGVGAFSAGVFHLFTHAFFKACLFLGAGSVIHALHGKQDIREMGGLSKIMPLTRATFLVSCLAISGIPFFSGFFSKDEILWQVMARHNPSWPNWFAFLLDIFAIIAAACTSLYMFRLYYLVFSGSPRSMGQTASHAHESPRVMTYPLVILAIGAALLGFLGLPSIFGLKNLFHHWLAPVLEMSDSLTTIIPVQHLINESSLAHHHPAEALLMLLSIGIALGGIFMARALYRGGTQPAADKMAARVPRVYRLVTGKYFIDEIYDWLVVRPLKRIGWLLWRFVDYYFIDVFILGFVCTTTVDIAGRISRLLHNGNVQRYLVFLVVGFSLIVFLIARPPHQLIISPLGPIKTGQPVFFQANPEGVSFNRRLEYQWDFDGDGRWDTNWSTNSLATHSFSRTKKYQVHLHVRDLQWKTTSVESKAVEVK